MICFAVVAGVAGIMALFLQVDENNADSKMADMTEDTKLWQAVTIYGK